MDIKFSEAEIEALILLRKESSILVSHISDKTEVDSFGNKVPGMSIFKKLAKKGFCFQTEEEPIQLSEDPNDEPFYFTESIELTEAGEALVKDLEKYF